MPDHCDGGSPRNSPKSGSSSSSSSSRRSSRRNSRCSDAIRDDEGWSLEETIDDLAAYLEHVLSICRLKMEQGQSQREGDEAEGNREGRETIGEAEGSYEGHDSELQTGARGRSHSKSQERRESEMKNEMGCMDHEQQGECDHSDHAPNNYVDGDQLHGHTMSAVSPARATSLSPRMTGSSSPYYSREPSMDPTSLEEPAPSSPKIIPSFENFQSATVPPISIRDYLLRFKKHAKVGIESLLQVAVHAHYLTSVRGVCFNECSLHRFCAASLILSSKVNSDRLFNNVYFGKVAGLGSETMNLLELELFVLLGFKVHAPTKELRIVHDSLRARNYDSPSLRVGL